MTTNNTTPDYSGLSATFLNCSLKADGASSHTRRLLERVEGVMTAAGTTVDNIYVRNHTVAFGMGMDFSDDNTVDEWPAIHERVMASDILVIGSPIWLGVKSSVATLAVERLYGYSAEKNEKGQGLFYGKTAGCVITGNEDGVKACAMDILYAMQHVGFVVPPQADCGWIGEAGPGPSYGDEPEGSGPRAGYDNDFTNKNATIMAWNLMHMASMLRASNGLSSVGNTPDGWSDVANASQFEPTV